MSALSPSPPRYRGLPVELKGGIDGNYKRDGKCGINGRQGAGNVGDRVIRDCLDGSGGTLGMDLERLHGLLEWQGLA